MTHCCQLRRRRPGWIAAFAQVRRGVEDQHETVRLFASTPPASRRPSRARSTSSSKTSPSAIPRCPIPIWRPGAERKLRAAALRTAPSAWDDGVYLALQDFISQEVVSGVHAHRSGDLPVHRSRPGPRKGGRGPVRAGVERTRRPPPILCRAVCSIPWAGARRFPRSTRSSWSRVSAIAIYRGAGEQIIATHSAQNCALHRPVHARMLPARRFHHPGRDGHARLFAGLT